MIVREQEGDIFESPRQTLVCPVNVVGAMGKGLAKAFADRYPGLLQRYREHFPKAFNEFVDPRKGRQLFAVPLSETQQCLLFPTKLHYRHDSPVALIHDNLRLLSERFESLGITSMAVPALGCGEGHLLYRRDIRPLFGRFLHPLPVEVDVVLPWTP